MPPRVSRLIPAMSLMGLLLLAPAIGSAQRFGVQGQAGTSGRGTSTPPNQGRSQQPPATPQTGSTQAQGSQTRPPQNPEMVLANWVWWKDEAVKKELKLTDMQVRSINSTFERRVKEITPFVEEFEKQRAELDRMTKERKVESSVYSLQVDRVESCRSKIEATRLIMLYTIYKQLTDEQNEKLPDIKARHWNNGRGRGAGPRTW